KQIQEAPAQVAQNPAGGAGGADMNAMLQQVLGGGVVGAAGGGQMGGADMNQLMQMLGGAGGGQLGGANLGGLMQMLNGANGGMGNLAGAIGAGRAQRQGGGMIQGPGAAVPDNQHLLNIVNQRQ